MDELISVSLKANVAQYVVGMGQAGAATHAFGGALTKASDKLQKVAGEVKKGLHLLGGAGIGLVATFIGLAAGASGFEGAMRNVQSITKDSWQTTLGYSAALLDFSRTSLTSANDLATGMYNVASSGFSGADALTIIKAASTAASAGLSDAATSSFALAAALNAYGQGAGSVTQVSDTMFKTVDLGVLTFQQLAQGMGDWISIAASAKVPLEDAAAALATITRGGIMPDEAATSLARIIQSFLAPTTPMLKAIKSLGFESGIAMLQTDGLKGSVENIAKVTKGSTDKIVTMFGDIRAGKGALALMSAAGQNYENVVQGMGTASTRAGATQKAFNIQARGLGAQLTFLKNSLKANAITLGQYLTPLARFGVMISNDVVRPVGLIQGPIHGAVVSIGLLTGALMIAAAGFGLWKLKSAVMFSLFKTSSLTLRGLAYVSGMLAGKNSALAISMNAAAGETSKWKAAISLARAGADKLGISLGMIGLVTAGVLVVIAAGIVGFAAWSAATKNAKKRADEFVKSIESMHDLSTSHGISRTIEDVNTQLKKVTKTSDSYGHGIGRTLQRTFENLSPMANTIEDADAQIKALVAEQENLANMQDRWQKAAANVNGEIIRQNRITGDSGKTIKLTNDEVAAFAKTLGVDLSKGGAAGEAGISKIAQAAIDASNAGITMGSNYGTAATKVVEMSKEAGKAATTFANDVRDAFTKTYDITGQFTGSIIDDFNKFKMVADKKNKGQKIKVFTEGVFKISDVMSFYQAAFKQDQVFEADLRNAITAGLDPSLIAKFMQAGPKEGGKLLHTLMASNAGPLRDMANQYNKTLDNMAAHTAELGRLTALAMNSPKDVLTKDLPTAMKVSESMMVMRGKHMATTFESVAAAAHLPVSAVEKIGTEFGISMKHAVRSFKDTDISRELSNVLAANMIDIKAPTTVSDILVKNLLSGDHLYKGMTDKMTGDWEKAHASFVKHLGKKGTGLLSFDLEAHAKIRNDPADDPFAGMSREQIVAQLLGVDNLDSRAIIDIIPDYRRALELKKLLAGDRTATVTVNALLATVTDPSDPGGALKTLLYAAATGQISQKTLEFGLKTIGSPEAMNNLRELHRAQKAGTDNTVVFTVDGTQVELELGKIKALAAQPVEVHIMYKSDTKQPGRKSQVTTVDSKAAESISNTGELYKAIVTASKTDKVNIKINADGSVAITHDKLVDIKKDLAKIDEAKKKKRVIDATAGPGLYKSQHVLRDVHSQLDLITGKVWNITVKSDVPNVNPRAAFGAIIPMADGGMTQRPKQAYIARKPTIMFGEQGTGGEAYIPLAPSRRQRSEFLLMQVAKMFGMKVSKMAVGGIIGDERFKQQHLADITKTAGQTASFAAAVAAATAGITDAKERIKAANDALMAMAKTYADVEAAAGHQAAATLAASGLVGDAWDAAAQRIIQAAQDAKTRWDNLWTDLWAKGKVTSDQYFKHLRENMSKLTPYSDEWLQLRDAINSAARAEQDVAHDAKAISDSTYMAILKKRLAATRKYSDEWKSIWDQINVITQAAIDEGRNKQDHDYAQHKIATSTYLSELQKRLNGTKKWSSEYMSILSQIEQIKQSFKDPILNATDVISHFGSTAPKGFGEVSNYFTHAIDAAKRFNADLATLKGMGLNQQLLTQLAQAGPSAVPFMDAIIKGGTAAVSQTNRSQAELASLAGQTYGAFNGPGSKVTGGASQTVNNTSTMTLSIGAITVGAGNGVTAGQVEAEIKEAFKVLSDELGKRNN